MSASSAQDEASWVATWGGHKGQLTDLYTKQIAQDQALSDPKAAHKGENFCCSSRRVHEKIKCQCMMLNDNWDEER